MKISWAKIFYENYHKPINSSKKLSVLIRPGGKRDQFGLMGDANVIFFGVGFVDLINEMKNLVLVEGGDGGELLLLLGWVGIIRQDLDEALEGVIWDNFFSFEDLYGGGTSVVAAVEPPLDAGVVVTDAGASAHRRFHYGQWNWAPK